jgi:hypothetical protein
LISILGLTIITQFYRMLTNKVQLVQSAIATAMSMGAFIAPAVRVHANPSLNNGQQPILSEQPTSTSPLPRPASGNAIATAPKIETVSGAAETALAAHLAANNVMFYGAYWCSHCQQQKSLFGATAAASLPYIECAADGENSQRQLCKDRNIQMFPTWVIGGKYFTGSKNLKEIATMTGYKGPMDFKYRK